MRVAIDLQPAASSRTGVGRYAWCLARHLPAAAPDIEFVGLSFGRSFPSEPLPGAMRLRRVRCLPPRAVSFLWKSLDWPPADLFTGRVDLFHFPSFVARRLRSGRSVATIHDLAFRRFPECGESKNVAFLETHIPRTLDRAALIFVDSEFTARELSEYYRYPRERVRVTLLGVEPLFSPRSREETKRVRLKRGLPERYILWAGTVEPRKNLGLLLEAYAMLGDGRARVPAPALVLAGPDGWRGEADRISRLAERLGVRGRVIRLPHVGWDELPALYTGAELFAFPSIHEGFGLPPLEAMACGTPVVCSNAASLPEVVGDAALMIAPGDAAGLAEAMARILDDAEFRNTLAAKGRERARRFTWQETARATAAAYREALAL